MNDQNGREFRIDKKNPDKNLVICFYPKDETTGCTKLVCAFSDAYHDFLDAGAEVIGISSDDVISHGNSYVHHKIPYILLSDIDGKIRKQFGAKAHLLGLIPGRTTYIIDIK